MNCDHENTGLVIEYGEESLIFRLYVCLDCGGVSVNGSHYTHSWDLLTANEHLKLREFYASQQES